MIALKKGRLYVLCPFSGLFVLRSTDGEILYIRNGSCHWHIIKISDRMDR